MSRPVLPIFRGEAPLAAEALSEVFVHPEAFTADVEEVGDFDPDPEKLISASTLYLGAGGEGEVPIEYVLSLDPNHLVGRATSAQMFMQGYRDRLDPFHGLADLLAETGSLTPRVVGVMLLEAVNLAAAEGEDLRSIASIHVTGTPESHSSSLVVRKKIVDAMTMRMRSRMVSGSFPEELKRRMPQMTKRDILTRSSIVKEFGLFAVTPLLPKSEIMQDITDDYLRTES